MPNIPFRELSGEVRALFIKNSALCTTDYNSYRAGFGYEARVVYREVVTPTSYGHTDTWVNKILINEKDEIDLGTFAKHFKTPEVPHLRTVYSEIYGTYRKATELVYNRYELHKYQFQIDDMPLLLMKDKGVLAYQQGLGKSLTALVWLRMKEAIYPDIRRSLTIVQQNLIPQWVEEARRVGTVYEILPLDPLHMSSKKHYITHYEFITKHYKTYLGKFQAILIDEGHKIKSPKSHRGRAIRQLDTPYKLCLTGTPIKNIMEDIHFLMGWTVGFKNNVYPYGEDEQTKLRKDFASYRYKDGHYGMTPLASRIQALQYLISPVFLRRDVNDIGVPMVEREIHLIKTNFIPEQKKAYDMISSSNDHPTVKMWEQRKNTILFPGSKKIEILTKLVYDVLRKKEQVIIYTGMVETGEFYQKMFSYVSRLVNGNILPSDQARIIDDFKKGKFEILIAGIEIGSTGHSLQNANNVIMTDFPWTSTSFDQAIARPWRINSKKKVNIYLISMNGSIDEEMNELIDTKRETSEMVLDGVNDYKVTNWKL